MSDFLLGPRLHFLASFLFVFSLPLSFSFSFVLVNLWVMIRRDGAGGDASIPTPHNPTPAPTRFYAVYRANPYEVGWSLEQAIGGKQPYKRLIGRIREIIHSTIWLNAGERARGRTLLQPRVASQLTAHASSR